MSEKEKLIWEGKPKYKVRWAFLEIIGGGADIGPYVAVLPVVLILNIIGIVKTFRSGSYFLFALLVLVLLSMMFLPEWHKHIRRKKTKYVVTNKKLTIYDYWYGKQKENSIYLKDVVRFWLVNYNDDVGVIHIYAKEKNFYTRNFWSGDIRPTITMEDVEYASEVFQKLNEALKQERMNYY